MSEQEEELIPCGWCFVPPGTQHDKDCPDRDDATDFPAYCGRCGVTYTTRCACIDGDEDE